MNNDKVSSKEDDVSIKNEEKPIKNAKVLTLTYLTPVSFASLNGSDKEADNMSNIKKITIGKDQFPYISAQAKRRAIRDQLGVLGEKLSEGVETTIAKGAASTLRRPEEYIDDDLFGYMGTEEASANAKGRSITRTSVVRTTPLLALSRYEGDLDFGTNFMSVKTGGDPNIFETEIHSGLYRGTDLIELDRIGKGDGFEKELDNKEKARRVKILLVAIKNLWLSGRQTRFLADVSPKFVVAAMLKTKNPIFLESVLAEGTIINNDILEETIKDFKNEIISCTIGIRQGMFTIGTQDGKIVDNTTQDGKIVDNTTQDGKIVDNATQDGKIVDNATQDGKIVDNATQDGKIVENCGQDNKPVGYVLQNCKTVGDAFEEMAKWIDDYYT